MTRQFVRVPILISFLCLLLDGTACGARKEKLDYQFFDGLDQGLFEKTKDNTDRDKALCERAIYSANFDKWLSAYLAGNDKECDRQWAQVLAHARGTTSLRPLFRSMNARLQFLEGKDRERSLARGDLLFADNMVLASTERVLGSNSLLVSTALEYMSNCYGDILDWKKAADYQLRAVKILEKVHGENSPKVVGALRSLTQKYYKAKLYSQCEAGARKLLKFGTRYGDKPLLKEATTYINISTRKQKAPAHLIKDRVEPPR